jgi:CubicO group peptidase (beta-lactamase class C family)
MPSVHMSYEDINDPRFRKVCDEILARMEKWQVPGVNLGIVLDGVRYTAGLGITNVDHPQPVTSGTIFQIGSTGKTFTAVAVMRLVEQGKIDLDAPLRTWLPDLKFTDAAATEKATMRHLLTHTGGWLGDHFTDCGNGDDVYAKYTATLAEIAQLTPVGEIFHYNNAGFILAGRVIEAVTGQVYEAAMRELVLEPLGLKHSFYFPAEMMHLPFACGHNNDPVTKKPAVFPSWPVPRFAAPAGGLVCDMSDQLTYAEFMMGDGKAADGTQVLKPETMKLMHTPQVQGGGGLGEWIGLSLMLSDVDGERVVFHGGSINGQQSDFRCVPSRKFGLALDTNANNGVFLHMEMWPIILETFLGIKAAKPEAVRLSAEKLGEYTGVYSRPDGYGYTLTIDEKGLVKVDPLKKEEDEPDENIKLAFYAQDKAFMVEGPALGMKSDFIRGADGKVRYFRDSGRIFIRQ